MLGAAEGIARAVAGPPEHRTLFQRWGGTAGEATFSQLFAGALGPAPLVKLQPRDPTVSWFVGQTDPRTGRGRYVRRPQVMMARDVDPPGIVVPAPAGVKRVFVLGGSSAYGVPGARNDAFSDELGRRLGAGWEVLNVANPGMDSTDILRVLRETARMSPAAYVLYEGHNDCGNAFSERRFLRTESPRALRMDVLLWNSLRVYSLLVGAVAPLRPDAAPAAESASVVADRRAARATQEALVVEQWRENLRAMITEARAAHAGVVFVQPASNLTYAPGASAHLSWLTGEDAARFEGVLGRARRGQVPLPELEAAAALDPDHAEMAWRLGLALVAAGRAEEAKPWLVRAKERDIVSVRAWESVIAAMREEGDAAGVETLDSRALLAGDDGFPAASWFVDNLHLTAEAHDVLGEALLEPVRRAAGGSSTGGSAAGG